MKNIIYIILLFLIFVSCNENRKQKDERIEIKENEFYEVLNFIIVNSDSAPVIVDINLKKSIKIANISIEYEKERLKNKDNPPLLLSLNLGTNSYELDYFIKLNKNNLIDIYDVMFMFNQLDKNYNEFIDTTKFRQDNSKNINLYWGFNNKIIFLKPLDHKEIDIQSIQISSPIYSVFHNKILIHIDYHCLGLGGYGKNYLLEKKDSKWKIIYENYTWIS